MQLYIKGRRRVVKRIYIVGDMLTICERIYIVGDIFILFVFEQIPMIMSVCRLQHVRNRQQKALCST